MGDDRTVIDLEDMLQAVARSLTGVGNALALSSASKRQATKIKAPTRPDRRHRLRVRPRAKGRR